jgi:hypothetical protein
MPTVVEVRMERAADGSHEHIAQVKTKKGKIHDREKVYDSINLKLKKWWSYGGGAKARIRAIKTCTECDAKKFIRTDPDASKKDNLDSLPRF